MSDQVQSHIRIKMGQIEVDFDGSEQFLKEELKVLLGEIAALHRAAGPELKSHATNGHENGKPHLDEGSSKKVGTTGTVAAKMAVASGPDLIRAAAAHLVLDRGIDPFDRKQLVAAMKSAGSYHKKTYVGNLSGYLRRLVIDGKLTEPTSGRYTLPAAARKELEAQLLG